MMNIHKELPLSFPGCPPSPDPSPPFTQISRHYPEDDAEAIRWFRLSAGQGYALAQFDLGVTHSRGEGVPEDDAEAVRWYRLAAEQGDPLAQHNIGFMYASGNGIPKDLVYAYMWFNLSAAQRNETAQSNNEKIEQVMTREQIAEAQRLSREWIETHPRQ